jgi:hypothetical protein
VRFGAEGVSGVPAGLGLWRTGGPAAGQLAAVGHRICRRATARARLRARNMLPTALRVCRLRLAREA